VVVTGEAGVGKSRLRAEALRRLRPPTELWMARGDPTSAGSPFGLLAQWIVQATGARRSEPPPLRQHRLLARLSRFFSDPDRARHAE
jgi:hypothetical protein